MGKRNYCVTYYTAATKYIFIKLLKTYFPGSLLAFFPKKKRAKEEGIVDHGDLELLHNQEKNITPQMTRERRENIDPRIEKTKVKEVKLVLFRKGRSYWK